MILLLVACQPEKIPTTHTVFESVDLGRLTTDADGRVDVPVPTEEGDVAGMVGCGPFGQEATAALDGDALLAHPLVNYFTVGWPQAPGGEAPTSIPLIFTSDALPLTVSCTGVRRMGAVPDDGTIALAVTFLGLPGIDMYEAAGVQPWLDALDVVDTIFGEVGIHLGDITYDDGDAALATLPADEVDALVDGVPDSGGVGIPVFVAEALEAPDANVRVPGYPETGVGPGSGIVVAGGGYDADPTAFGRRLAHALGHHLGLFHPEDPDPIADTEPGDNVMDSEPGAHFTAEQGEILRTSVNVSE